MSQAVCSVTSGQKQIHNETPFSLEEFVLNIGSHPPPVFQVYANGIRNIDLQYIVRKLAAPVISVLLLSLCVPYVIASGIVPLLGGFIHISTFLSLPI